MSWLFSQVLVEEYLGENSLDGEQSVPLSGNITQLAYLPQDKMMDFSRLFRFGMMFKPLTENLGEELLMLYRADFHAKTSPLQGGGDGLEGKRSGMWTEMARIISEVRPRFVFVENSPMLTTRGLGTVLADLAQMGFDAEWGVLGADTVGAYHRRDRIWVVAHSSSIGLDDRTNKRNSSKKQKVCANKPKDWNRVWCEADKCLSTDDWKSFASEFLGMDDGLASRLDRLKAAGNGQVPQVAAKAWNLLSERLQGYK
jgi:DNA (cytosine-5)-methyltransferase 1